MSEERLAKDVKDICAACGNDRARMMDIVEAVQAKFGCVTSEAMDVIAKEVSSHRVEVESVVSFYAFLSSRPKGKVVIRVCDDIIDRLVGVERVAEALKEELGIDFGETTPDGRFTLEKTPCIGMCDQAPAIMINDVIATYMSGDKAKELIQKLKVNDDPSKLTTRLGDGNNANELVRSMVHNNIREKGMVFGEYIEGQGLKKALFMSPNEVLREVKTARLRGRGGAGFPAGMKWEFTRAAEGENKVVICNADEGEPGTFKDRAILTERSDLLFEGMTIAAYAIGANIGIVYLRGEYAYLRAFLENALQKRRDKNLLGNNICGKAGFNFDIRIQMGAGAYVCGEETALISSCEGLRGDPKNRPPFPAQKGYLGYPTSVNNVETFCAAVRVIENGAAWFAGMGSRGSSGTKVLSVSGDCERPGIYEVPFGITLEDLLKKVGAIDPFAVQIGGPSGQMVGEADFKRIICYDDLATGGSIMIFDKDRDILKVVDYFMDFFVEESCGYCTPCRVGNVVLKELLENVIEKKADKSTLATMESLGASVKTASRCGLGQTSPNPVLTTLKNFRSVYESHLVSSDNGFNPSFDISKAVKEAETLQGRKSVVFT